MPGQIRPNKEAMKIAYKILETPKSKQQGNSKAPSKRKINEWEKDSSNLS